MCCMMMMMILTVGWTNTVVESTVLRKSKVNISYPRGNKRNRNTDRLRSKYRIITMKKRKRMKPKVKKEGTMQKLSRLTILRTEHPLRRPADTTWHREPKDIKIPTNYPDPKHKSTKMKRMTIVRK